MKSGVSPQKYRWQTSIWASICTPVAPSLLISSGHSPRLGGELNFRLGGMALVCPPVAPGLPNSLLFSPARICPTDKIKLTSAQRNDLMQ